jgi:hypothetical protein
MQEASKKLLNKELEREISCHFEVANGFSMTATLKRAATTMAPLNSATNHSKLRQYGCG